MSVDTSSPRFGAEFTFKTWSFEKKTGRLICSYHDSVYGSFDEIFVFHDVAPERFVQYEKAICEAIDCLFWMAGVSYYKTSLSQNIVFKQNKPSHEQAQWLTQTWQAGLAELAFTQGLGWLSHIEITGIDKKSSAAKLKLQPRSLVAIGGGKDSLVSIEAIKTIGESASLFMVGQSAFIKSVAVHTSLPLIAIERQLDPRLRTANQKGAFNGHIPITAINACVGVVVALLYDFDSVVFSNERSADVGNVQTEGGQWVNHQYSKSLRYEQCWQNLVHQYIATDLYCFSLLRPFSELAIVKRFAELSQYFPHFSSCNRNFHLTGSENKDHHWCGKCPKCAFVFLCLAPFVSADEIITIFQKDLFADSELTALFHSLLGIEGMKPFECVGEQQECRLAVTLLSQHKDWQNHPQVKAWQEILPKISKAEQQILLTASSRHQIPDKRQFLQVLTDET